MLGGNAMKRGLAIIAVSVVLLSCGTLSAATKPPAMFVLPTHASTRASGSSARAAYTLSVVSMAMPAPAMRIYEPQAGTTLLGVQVAFSNLSGPTVTTNPLSFSLVDSDGYVYECDTGSVTNQLALLEIGAGEKNRGWVGFTVPNGTRPASIRWSRGGVTIEASIR
jgi:hypothetical protein